MASAQGQPSGIFRTRRRAVCAGQRQALGEGDQVLRERADFQPDGVLGGVVEGQVAQAGVLGGADAVLDAGVAAVP